MKYIWHYKALRKLKTLNRNLFQNKVFCNLLFLLILLVFYCKFKKKIGFNHIDIKHFSSVLNNDEFKSDDVLIYTKHLKEISFKNECNYENSKNNDCIPTSDNIIATKESIFFHETSTKGELTVRQACSVESCARNNVKSQINVIFSSTINSNTRTFEILQKINNIRFFRVHIESYVKGTPMAKFNLSILSNSWWPMQVTSDALRYLTLYKFGGVYLDLDVMVVRPLRVLGNNWASQEYWHIGSGALAFGRDKLGKYVSKIALKDFVKKFSLTSFSNNGPLVITRVLKRLCNKHYKEVLNSQKTNDCQGFKIYNNITFNPLPYTMANLYFMSLVYIKMDVNSNNTYGYHMYNYVTKRFIIKKTSFYAKLAKKFCPKIYKTFIHEFSH